MSNTITSNVLDQFSKLVACASQIDAEKLKSIIIGLKVRALLAKCPSILDDTLDNNNIVLLELYARIQCGTVLSQLDTLRANALIEIKEAECNISINDSIHGTDEKAFVFASGFWTMSSGNLYIPVAGILNTDKVFVQLTDLNGTEYIKTAKANNSSSRIDLTFANTPANTATKAQWFVIR